MCSAGCISNLGVATFYSKVLFTTFKLNIQLMSGTDFESLHIVLKKHLLCWVQPWEDKFEVWELKKAKLNDKNPKFHSEFILGDGGCCRWW